MKKLCASIAGASIALAGLMFAGPAAAADLPVKAKPKDPLPPVVAKTWVSAEFLYWWLKGQELSVPVAVTSNSPIVGFGNDDFVTGTFSPLLGPGNLGTKGAPGLRLSAGGWLNEGGTLRLEASGFWLGQANTGHSFGSNGAGNPFLGVPFVLQDGTAQTLVIATPVTAGTVLAGAIAAESSSQLWGVDANTLWSLPQVGGLKLEGLAGFRYLDLSDTFDLRTSSRSTAGTIFFNGAFVPLGSVQTADSFATRNQFFGAQLGVRGTYDTGPFTVGVTGKIALGAVHETLDVFGSTVGTNAAGAVVGSFGRGLFAMPNNSGSRSQTLFAYVPELQAKVSYAVTPRVTLFVGYDFLFLSEAARAAGQLDSNTDSRLQPRNVAFNPAFQAGVPSSSINSSDFWVHGITAGIKATF